MPIMTRMRDSMPIILFGLLIAFLITIIFEWGMDYLGMRGGGGDVIGKISGKKIHYKEFSELLKNFTDNQKAQGGGELDEEQLRQARDQTWQAMVTQQLVSEEIKRMGITLVDQELVDWVHGENPPEDLRRNFVDSAGQFRREMYEQFLANPNQFLRDPKGVDAEYGTRWLAEYEKNLRQRRLQEKLQSIVLASVRVSEGEIRQRFVDQNQKLNALYILVDANAMVKDSDVQVLDADLKSYYEENIEQYRFEATRKLRYVTLLETPSAADSAARKRDIDEAAEKAQKGFDFLQLVSTYADKPDSGAFFRHGELSPTLENLAFSARAGEIAGPVLDADGYHLLKVLEDRKSDKEYARASHILFQFEGEQDSNAVKALAQRVLRGAREGKDFATLAKQYSRDVASGQRGGDLGWFTRGRMAPTFEDAVFKARIGEVVGPVRTPFGLHLIKVAARDSRELKLVNITMKIAASSQTRSDISERARDFAYNAKGSEFVKEAQQTGFEVRETYIQEKGGVIPGIGMNESITRWAFNNKVGSVSEPFTILNGSAVFEVAEIKDAGVRPFDELKESIRPLVLRKKKIEQAKMIAADLRGRLVPGDSLTKVSQLNSSVSVQETGPFTLAGSIPGIGRDPGFLGVAAGLEVGQISSPVQGQRGAYLIQLLSRSKFDSTAYSAQRDLLQSRFLQEKRNRFLADWLEKLKEKADIEDNRERFFR